MQRYKIHVIVSAPYTSRFFIITTGLKTNEANIKARSPENGHWTNVCQTSNNSYRRTSVIRYGKVELLTWFGAFFVLIVLTNRPIALYSPQCAYVSIHFSVFSIFTPPKIGGAKYYNQRACLYVCPLAYLKTTRPNFKKFSIHCPWLWLTPLPTIGPVSYIRISLCYFYFRWKGICCLQIYNRLI